MGATSGGSAFGMDALSNDSYLDCMPPAHWRRANVIPMVVVVVMVVLVVMAMVMAMVMPMVTRECT